MLLKKKSNFIAFEYKLSEFPFILKDYTHWGRGVAVKTVGGPQNPRALWSYLGLYRDFVCCFCLKGLGLHSDLLDIVFVFFVCAVSSCCTRVTAFSGTFEKLRKATVSFAMSVLPSVRPHGITRTHWTDFHESSYFCISRKCAEIVEV